MPLDPRADENRLIEHVREDLVREFTSLPPAVVHEHVARVTKDFTQAPVRSYVPVLVRRGARDRLRHLG